MSSYGFCVCNRGQKKWRIRRGKTDVSDMLLPTRSIQTLQTNEVYAVTCKQDNGSSITVQNSCLQLRLPMFWLTFQRCWAMHSETFHPPVCPLCLQFPSCEPNQTNWQMLVTHAPEECFAWQLVNRGIFSSFQNFPVSSAGQPMVFRHSLKPFCIKWKTLPLCIAKYFLCYHKRL